MTREEIMDGLDDTIIRSCHAVCTFISTVTLSLEPNKTLFIIVNEG